MSLSDMQTPFRTLYAKLQEIFNFSQINSYATSALMSVVLLFLL